jgi:NarL family two-component system response regulator LiaR
MAERVLEESQMIADQNDIRVLIADDHEIIRKGLRIFLEYEGFQCVGEAENGVRAVDLCNEFHPDVVLMDLVMPQMDGIEATRLIRKNNPQTQVIALTNYDLDDNVLQVLQAGATSFLVKNVTIEDIADAIRAASVGQSTLSTEAITNLVSNNKQPQFQLTPRELEILNLMTQAIIIW